MTHLPLIDFNIELIHYEPLRSMQTPLNSKQWTLMSPRRTLANTNYLGKRKVKLCPPIVLYIIVLYIIQTLVKGFCKTVHHLHWIQRPGIIVALLLIVLAFLAMVQQRRGLKMLPHRVQQNITTPTESIPV